MSSDGVGNVTKSTQFLPNKNDSRSPSSAQGNATKGEDINSANTQGSQTTGNVKIIDNDQGNMIVEDFGVIVDGQGIAMMGKPGNAGIVQDNTIMSEPENLGNAGNVVNSQGNTMMGESRIDENAGSDALIDEFVKSPFAEYRRTLIEEFGSVVAAQAGAISSETRNSLNAQGNVTMGESLNVINVQDCTMIEDTGKPADVGSDLMNNDTGKLADVESNSKIDDTGKLVDAQSNSSNTIDDTGKLTDVGSNLMIDDTGKLADAQINSSLTIDDTVKLVDVQSNSSKTIDDTGKLTDVGSNLTIDDTGKLTAVGSNLTIDDTEKPEDVQGNSMIDDTGKHGDVPSNMADDESSKDLIDPDSDSSSTISDEGNVDILSDEEIKDSVKEMTVPSKEESEMIEVMKSLAVDEILCHPVGTIRNIVEATVVVQSNANTPPLNIDTVLFLDKGKQILGKIDDVFGPISCPLYCVNMPTPQRAEKLDLNEVVYCAPQTDYTSYVQVSQLLRDKGSDASWLDDKETPPEFIQYSDDEEEAKAKARKKKQVPAGSKRPNSNSSEDVTDFVKKMNRKNNHLTRKRTIADSKYAGNNTCAPQVHKNGYPEDASLERIFSPRIMDLEPSAWPSCTGTFNAAPGSPAYSQNHDTRVIERMRELQKEMGVSCYRESPNPGDLPAYEAPPGMDAAAIERFKNFVVEQDIKYMGMFQNSRFGGPTPQAIQNDSTINYSQYPQYPKLFMPGGIIAHMATGSSPSNFIPAVAPIQGGPGGSNAHQMSGAYPNTVSWRTRPPFPSNSAANYLFWQKLVSPGGQPLSTPPAQSGPATGFSPPTNSGPYSNEPMRFAGRSCGRNVLTPGPRGRAGRGRGRFHTTPTPSSQSQTPQRPAAQQSITQQPVFYGAAPFGPRAPSGPMLFGSQHSSAPQFSTGPQFPPAPQYSLASQYSSAPQLSFSPQHSSAPQFSSPAQFTMAQQRSSVPQFSQSPLPPPDVFPPYADESVFSNRLRRPPNH